MKRYRFCLAFAVYHDYDRKKLKRNIMKSKLFYASLIFITLIVSVINATDQEECIEKLYAKVSGFNIAGTECTMIEKNGGAPTYGEITYQAAKKLLDSLNLTQNDVFYDFGSGVGKMVVQTYLTTPVKKAVGIELSPTRVNRAKSVKDKLEKQGKVENGRTLDFKEENITTAKFDDATVVYMCSTCYSEALMKQIADMLAKLKKGLRVVTLKKLPDHKAFKLTNTYNLPMTWSSDVSVHVYELVG